MLETTADTAADPANASSRSRWRFFRRRSTAPGTPPVRPLDLGLLIAGGACLVSAAVLGLTAPSSDATPYPQVSVTAVLDAAARGQLEVVRIPSATTSATATLAAATDSGMLADELGGSAAAGQSVSFFAPVSVQPLLLESLADASVPVWMAPTATPTARYGRVSPAAPPAAASPAPTGSSPSMPLLLVAGILLTAVGTVRAVGYRSRRKSERKAEQELDDSVPATRFTDVAGADEAVEQLAELVELLKSPERFQALGARLPKGALLVGPPGTGKTLLARAVAGEAGVKFFAVSGSDFVAIFVGSGPKAVRELFARARKAERAIVFIDEIDAVARARSSAGDANPHVEGENTLNALLHEMDGFAASNIIVIGATNRPDVLDPAITRPGRLERRVEVPLPDRRGREQILLVHAAAVPLSADTDLAAVARRTPGFSGAQLQSVVNEAALEAVRRGLDSVTPACLDASVAMVAMGRPRTSALVTEADRRITAWHEAGHTVAALLLADADPPVAVSIVPRGAAGGVTWMSGTDEQFLSRAKAHARLVVALGGRAAEQLHMDGEFTQGAASDLENATHMALLMATRYGMTRLGLASREHHLGGTTTKEVAEVVEELLAQAHAEATSLLSTHQALVGAVAAALLEHEDLDALDLARLAAAHGVTPSGLPTPIPVVPSHSVRPGPVGATTVAVPTQPAPTQPAPTQPAPSRLMTSGIPSPSRWRAMWNAATRQAKPRRSTSA